MTIAVASSRSATSTASRSDAPSVKRNDTPGALRCISATTRGPSVRLTVPIMPKVACPVHKKTFALKTGECLSGDDLHIRTFAVKEENGEVFVELPPPQQLVAELCSKQTSTYVDAAE